MAEQVMERAEETAEKVEAPPKDPANGWRRLVEEKRLERERREARRERDARRRERERKEAAERERAEAAAERRRWEERSRAEWLERKRREGEEERARQAEQQRRRSQVVSLCHSLGVVGIVYGPVPCFSPRREGHIGGGLPERSVAVDLDSAGWSCSVCGARGDAYEMALAAGLGHDEALRLVAAHNLTLPEFDSRGDRLPAGVPR